MKPRATILVAAALGSALALAGAALAARSFSDPPGDGNAAPDLTGVTVAESNGNLTVSATVRNYQAFPPASWINVWLDLDNDGRTALLGANEAVVTLNDRGEIGFFHVSGLNVVRRPVAGLTGSFAAGTITLTFPTTALDGVTTFGVVAVAVRSQDFGDDDELLAGDLAPSEGLATYAPPGPLTIPDPAHDHNEAPDLTSLDVSDTRSGTVTFAIATPSHETLSPSTWVELDFDLDRRRSTGGFGAEAYVLLDGEEARAARWSPEKKRFVRVAVPGVTARSSGGVVRFDVPRAFLGDVASFDFYAISGDSADGTDHALDFAPDGAGWWSYTLAHRPPLRLLAGKPTGTPSRPVAGRRFGVAVPVTRSDTARELASGSVACDVRVAGAKVRATGSVKNGVARCSLVVPRNTAGSRVRGSMVVRSAGASARASFAFPVR